MSVTPISGEGVVARLHGGTKTGGDCLHPERKMGSALDQVLEKEVMSSFAELSQLME
jgi:hypothetical protein